LDWLVRGVGFVNERIEASSRLGCCNGVHVRSVRKSVRFVNSLFFLPTPSSDAEA
jgi:hypothetical protein